MLVIIIISFMAQLCIFSLREKLRKRRAKKKEEIEDLIDKYVVEDKKGFLRQKLAKVFELIAKTEEYIENIIKRKVKVVEEPYEFTKRERNLIQKAKVEYDSFISEFASALPSTEEQRILDMKELQNAISILESFDAETYETEEKVYDAGTGIFYDKMSRKFMFIIDENKLIEYDFIPIQRIKYHAFSTIKNIKDEDFIPVLNIMKETNLIDDIIEVNPQFHIIVFTDEKKIDLSIPEKVLLSFAYDQEILTIQKLVKLTEWKEDYAKKVIDKLVIKDIISIQGNNITVKSFGNIKERNKWNAIIEHKIQQEKEAEEKKYERQMERAAQLKKKAVKVEEIQILDKIISEPEKEEVIEEIKFTEKPSVKELPLPKEEAMTAKVATKQKQETKDKDEIISAIDALDEIMPTKTATIKDTEQEEVETPDIQDLIPEKILNYHEKFSLINGGFSQYDKIKQYLDQELENVPEDLLIKILEQLKELELIQDSIKIGSHDFYLFNDFSLTDDDKVFIEFAINKKPMIKEDFVQGLNWDEERIFEIIKNLQEKNILKIENNQIIIPGIIQKE